MVNISRILAQKWIAIHEMQEWQLALNSIPHAHTHTHWYNQAMHLATQRPIFLYTCTTDEYQVACPCMLRQRCHDDPFDLVTPYGFSGVAGVGNFEMFWRHWHEFMREHKIVCGYLGMHPLLHADFPAPAGEKFFGKNIYALAMNVDHSLADLFKKFSKSHHYVLKQWWREAWPVVNSKAVEYRTAFYDLYEPTLKRKNASQVYYFGRSALEVILAADNTYLLSVCGHQQVEASAIFILHDEIADFFLVATTPDGQRHTRGLIWEGMKLCHERKLRWLNLGGGVAPGDTLELFKARFGGQAIQTYALQQIYNQQAYQALCAKYQVDLKAEATYFPSYWRRM